MRRRAALLGLLTAAVTVAVTATPAAAALPAFGTAQVSGSGSGGQTVLTSITVGHHTGFDRVVFTSSKGIGTYRVGYVSQVTADASGKPVPLLGSAFLLVTFEGTPWTTHPAPQPTITPLFPALRQLKGAGEFEAFAHYGIGQATKAGFRAYTLTGPSRLVVDVAAPAAAALPAFGTAPVSGPAVGGAGPGKQSTILSVTVGRHASFDRVVITSKDGRPAYTVRYVPALTQDASGAPVTLLGSAILQVTLQGTSTETPAPQPTITPGFPALKQVKGAGDFEAVTTYGLGQATKAGFRVFTLTGPDRIVVDLKHPASTGTTRPAGSTGTAAGTGTATGTTGGTKGAAESSGGTLPNTGFPILPVAGLGVAVLVAGALALTGLRRRALS